MSLLITKCLLLRKKKWRIENNKYVIMSRLYANADRAHPAYSCIGILVFTAAKSAFLYSNSVEV